MTLISSIRTVGQPTATSLRALTFALAVFAAGVGFGTLAPAAFGQSEGTDPHEQTCATDVAQANGDDPFVRTELFFGTARPDGSAVTEAEWRAFLAEEITPRFPDGLTVVTGLGQWSEGDGAIVQERSKLVILLYPRDGALAGGALVEEIRAAYTEQFQQESVLWASDSLPVCVSFAP
jgi:hypothetical protein